MDYKIIIGFVLMIFMIAVEGYFSSQWNFRYFTIGIPIFRRVIRLPHVSEKILDGESLTTHFQKVQSILSLPALTFHELDVNRIAFKGNIFHLSASIWNFWPVMRGLIRFNERNFFLEIVGYLNWYVVGFYCLAVSIELYIFDFSEHTIIKVLIFIIVYPLLLFCFCYIWNFLLFNKVYNHIKNAVRK